ncbi:MAG TPA: sialidase family protein [Mycobacteriales bacterium]|nr:sialidase family protein [Mycobacteriales bacterium]
MRTGVRRASLIGLLIAAVGMVTSAPAAPADPGTDHPAMANDGTRANEPAIAVNPRDPRMVITAANSSGTGTFGAFDAQMNGYYSLDGGKTFASGGGMPKADGARYLSDPHLDYDSRGRAYSAYLTYNPTMTSAVGGVAVAVDQTGGRRWPDARMTLVERNRGFDEDGECKFQDFPALAVDRGRGAGGRPRDIVYVAWQQPTFDGDSCSNFVGTYLRFARSTDGGRTFSRPMALGDPDDGIGYVPTLAVAPDGTVYVTHLQYPAAESCPGGGYAVDVVVEVSRDGGRTFTSNVADLACFGMALPGLGLVGFNSTTGAMYRLHPAPNLSVDPRSGALVLVYGHLGADKLQDVRVLTSRDRGTTWRVGGSITSELGAEQHFPRIATAPNGREIVLFYATLPGGGLIASSAVSADDGKTWSMPTALATLPSNGHDALYTGKFIGDYIGIAVGRDGVAHPVWTDLREVRGLSTQAIWTREVSP